MTPSTVEPFLAITQSSSTIALASVPTKESPDLLVFVERGLVVKMGFASLLHDA
jgi:hypothetical protein